MSFAKSVIDGMNGGRIAKSIIAHKAPPKVSLNPTVPKKPIQFRKYNPIKSAIKARGSKKLIAKIGKFPTSLPQPSVGSQAAPLGGI